MNDVWALTIWQPWVWAIFRGSKRIENRTWHPPQWVIGKRILIHAGKHYDEDGRRWIEQWFGKSPPVMGIPIGAFVGEVTVDGSFVRQGAHDFWPVRSNPTVTYSELRWFTGPAGWVLRDPVELRSPVACRGRQGLWRVPAEVAHEVSLARVA